MLQSFLWNCAVFVVAFLSFATYSLMDTSASRLTAETAFVSLAIFNNMRSLFRMLPREDREIAEDHMQPRTRVTHMIWSWEKVLLTSNLQLHFGISLSNTKHSKFKIAVNKNDHTVHPAL